MQENPDINKPLDLKDMQKLLIDKSNIGTPIPVSYDKYKFKKYNLINPPLRSVRILNSYTVKYFSQTYLYDEISQKFEQCDKNYKNIKKDKISSMNIDKKYIRYCLLLMMQGEQSLFEFDKNTLGEEFYQKQVNELIKDKKRIKEKELKEIEREKIKEQKQKEIEELKKKGEYEEGVVPSKNPLPPQPKQEIKIDMEIVNNIPNNYKFDGKIYYRIFTQFVQLEKFPFPKNAIDLEKYVKDFSTEIKRLLDIDKETNKDIDNDKKKGNYEYLNIAESWCNELINKIINMGKGKMRDEYESAKFKEKRKIIEEELKKPLLSLMFIYYKKMDNDAKIIRQAINFAENIYFPRFKNHFDKSYLKIAGWYISCLIKTNDFSKAKKIIEIVKTKCKDLKETELLLKDLESKLNEAERKKNSENIMVSKGKIKAAADTSKPDYDWQKGINEDELNDDLNKDAEQVKNNMELINSTK